MNEYHARYLIQLETRSDFCSFGLPRRRCVQLDGDLLLHVLHINGVSHCVFFPRPQVRPPLAPRPAAAPAQEQWHGVPFGLVVCCACARYWLCQLDPMMTSICQHKTHVDIYYRGVVIHPAGQYAESTGFNTRTMQYFS